MGSVLPSTHRDDLILVCEKAFSLQMATWLSYRKRTKVEDKQKRGQTMTLMINHNISIALERSVINQPFQHIHVDCSDGFQEVDSALMASLSKMVAKQMEDKRLRVDNMDSI